MLRVRTPEKDTGDVAADKCGDTSVEFAAVVDTDVDTDEDLLKGDDRVLRRELDRDVLPDIYTVYINVKKCFNYRHKGWEEN